MDEPAQRVVDPRRVEQSDRPLEAGADFEGAVGDLVADHGERRHGEEARQFGGGGAAAAKFVAALEDVRIRDFLPADADLDRRAEFLDQRLELFEQIVAEVLGLGDGRRIDARLAELGEGARAGGRHGVRIVGDAQFGIAEARPHRRVGRLAVDEKFLNRGAQRGGRLGVKLGEPIDRLRRRVGASKCSDRLLFASRHGFLALGSLQLALAAMQAISTL